MLHIVSGRNCKTMLTQAEADQFMAMTKHFVRPPAAITIPPGADDTYELADPNDREKFLLDVWRGTISSVKTKVPEQSAGCNRPCTA